MRFFKRNFLTLCCLTLLVAMGMCGDAWADGASLMGQAQNKTRNVFDSVKTIMFILGGFGLVGVAFQAVMGKIKWVGWPVWLSVWPCWLLPVQLSNMRQVPVKLVCQRLLVRFNKFPYYYVLLKI